MMYKKRSTLNWVITFFIWLKWRRERIRAVRSFMLCCPLWHFLSTSKNKTIRYRCQKLIRNFIYGVLVVVDTYKLNINWIVFFFLYRNIRWKPMNIFSNWVWLLFQIAICYIKYKYINFITLIWKRFRRIFD